MDRRKLRQKKIRRSRKRVIKFGAKAKAAHKSRSGRTGTVDFKKFTPSKVRLIYSFTLPSRSPARCEFWIFEGLK